MPSFVTTAKNAVARLPEFGLQKYKNISVMEQNAPHMSVGKPFRNFQWTLFGKVARCAQPGYEGRDDTAHSLSQAQLDYLIARGIKRVISLNHCWMDKFSVQRLRDKGIAFQHIRIPDFEPISQTDLRSITENINATAGATLVYCGYGEGRTGTAISAWALRRILLQQPRFFQGFNWPAFGLFLKTAFGVEMATQYGAIGTYLKSFAAPTIPARQGRPARPRLIQPSFINGLQGKSLTAYEAASSAAQFAAGGINQILHNDPNFLANAAGATDDMVEDRLVKIVKGQFKMDDHLNLTGPLVRFTPPAQPDDEDAEQGQTLWEMGSDNGLQPLPFF